METIFNVKPVEFKFGEYLNKGFELFKKDIGTFILAFFFTLIMSIIPIFSFQAVGNFLKLCRKIDKGEKRNAADIFSFDNFGTYFTLFLVLVGIVFAVELPIILMTTIFNVGNKGEEANTSAAIIFFALVFAIIFVLIYFLLKAYYMIGLIALENEQSIKKAWNISKVMTSGNLLMILIFSIVVGLISQIGIILCGIGLFLTMPLQHIFQYYSMEDGINQIKHHEIEEIGNNTL